MSENANNSNNWLEAYVGDEIIVDLNHSFQVYGQLLSYSHDHITLGNVDLHDLNEANSSKDMYALETKQIGIRANRKECSVPRRNIICISRLDEVLP